ncbi:exodeoxyribonuclease VII small subunit [Caballeronia glebae]|uniref:exodeoxyribonuclease VII small subunit n=1 Tax=Caballeronia glebae TaxID=1777143 RepID=UPI0038BB80D0
MSEKTFREAYGVLQKHAETLRNQQEPNIDDLLTIVTESVAAYKVCKERIDAVEAALEQALSGAGVSGAGGTGAGGTGAGGTGAGASGAEPVTTQPKESAPFEDDDIPF